MEQKNNNDKPSGISIAALITGILGLSIVPIILAIVDIRRIKRGESSSQGMVFDIDKAGFPLISYDDRIFYHFFPLTRIQFEKAIASGWLLEATNLELNHDSFSDLLTRGEVVFSKFINVTKF